MLLKYESSDGIKIYFNRAPENRIMKIGGLRNYSRSYMRKGKNLTFSQTELKEFEIEFSCMPDNADASADKDFVTNIFERDCILGKYGRFYIGSNYILCNIFAQDIQPESEKKSIFHTKCKLVTPSGWFKDSEQIFYGKSAESEEYEAIKDLPFDLRKPQLKSFILNNSEAIKESDVKITFETTGNEAINNPTISIGDKVYSVNISLNAAQKIVIDPVNKTVVRTNKITDVEESVFSHRSTTSYIFEKIAEGYHLVSLSDNLKATVQLMQERVTPLWT